MGLLELMLLFVSQGFIPLTGVSCQVFKAEGVSTNFSTTMPLRVAGEPVSIESLNFHHGSIFLTLKSSLPAGQVVW